MKPGKPLWNIEELELFFSNIKLPAGPMVLSPAVTIVDMEKFVLSHIATVKAHNGNKTFYPYYERLLQFKSILTKNTDYHDSQRRTGSHGRFERSALP